MGSNNEIVALGNVYGDDEPPGNNNVSALFNTGMDRNELWELIPRDNSCKLLYDACSKGFAVIRLF